MALLLSLRQQGLTLPGGALLFCPWVDLEGVSQAGPFVREVATRAQPADVTLRVP